MQKAKEKYSKEKAAEYYLENKEAIKKMSRNRYKRVSKKKISATDSVQKKALQNK